MDTVSIERPTAALVGREILFLRAMAEVLGNAAFGVIGCVEDTASVDPDWRPDFVILESAGRSSQDGADIRILTHAHHEAVVILMSSNFNAGSMIDALAAGARGYLTKSISAPALLLSMRLAALGETVFPSELAPCMARRVGTGGDGDLFRFGDFNLSNIDIEILSLLIKGESNRAIGVHLGMDVASVKVSMKKLLRRMGLNNRTQAALWAAQNFPTRQIAMLPPTIKQPLKNDLPANVSRGMTLTPQVGV